MSDGYTITLHDPRHDSDDDIAERVALSQVLQEEILPGDPPTPLEQAVAAQRATPERMRRWSFRARDQSGTLVAIGSTRIDPDHDDNPHLLHVGIHVHPDHRRRGIGTSLLRELTTVAAQEGRSLVLGATHEKVPAGESFARSTGATPKLAAHVNHLPIAEVDRAMLETWVAEGPLRAAEYEMFGFDGSVPEDILEPFVALVLVMNTAPRDELEMEDFTLTPQQWREQEIQMSAAGHERWTLVVRHRGTGELAGFHDVMWNRANPAVVWVGATGVMPAHRGHAIGKWLKAAMTLRILHERPGVTDIRTGNADSNDAMLGINRLMGYRPMLAETVWTVGLDTLERWLGRRQGSEQPTTAV